MSHDISRRQFVGRGALATAAAAGLTAVRTIRAGEKGQPDTDKIRSYNENMEYRRCGRTDLMVSASAMGGHWKRIHRIIGGEKMGGWMGNIDRPGFEKNRYDVISRCISRGINWIDACTIAEIRTYARALKGRRESMYIACSWAEKEVRKAEYRTFDKLKETIDWGLKDSGLEYCDLWRITCHEQSNRHTAGEVEEVMKALEWAKKTGRARFVGLSSHDRPHIKKMIETYPEILEVIVTPYTAKSQLVTDESGLWATLQKHDIGWMGIKPFASNSLFKGDSSPQSPTADEDNRIARLALRHILCNPAITAPIPGLISEHQVDNAALAILERRELDQKEQADLGRAMDEAWAKLPPSYQWLKDWEYV
jgi:aryl-alcohol dehydrogenase-like predicted oxidoreductase